jgi:hypothetical protein
VVLEPGDDQGRSHKIPKLEIEERVKQTRSAMPEGLETRLTDREVLDLVTFLSRPSPTHPRSTQPRRG